MVQNTLWTYCKPYVKYNDDYNEIGFKKYYQCLKTNSIFCKAKPKYGMFISLSKEQLWSEKQQVKYHRLPNTKNMTCFWIPSAAWNIKSLCVSYITSFKLTLCFTSYVVLVSTWRNILQWLIQEVWFLITALSLGFNINSHSVQFLSPQLFHKRCAFESQPQSDNNRSYFYALNWMGQAISWQGGSEGLTQHNTFPRCVMLSELNSFLLNGTEVI